VDVRIVRGIDKSGGGLARIEYEESEADEYEKAEHGQEWSIEIQELAAILSGVQRPNLLREVT
jgi:hypothetical protein